jgi:hypothetical protein
VESLPALCERLSLIPGTGANGRLALKLSLLPANPDRALWQQVTDWEREARALLEPLRRFLVENVAACRNARLDSVAPQLGVRSGRRILGRARLTDQDVLGARKSPAGIARGCWPMERWTNSPRPEMTYFAERDFMTFRWTVCVRWNWTTCGWPAAAFPRDGRHDFGAGHRHRPGDRLGGGNRRAFRFQDAVTAIRRSLHRPLGERERWTSVPSPASCRRIP